MTFQPMIEREAVVVIGAGAVGLAAAISLAQSGFPVTLIGEVPTPRPGRTVALLQGSASLLETLGVWPALAAKAAPLRTMRLVDATDSLFRPPPVSFHAGEIGLPAFGYNVENAALEAALREVARETQGLSIVTATATRFAFGDPAAVVDTDVGTRIEGRLLVAADGRHSRVRKAARIGVRTTAHPQTALTAVFSHHSPHHDISTEFHTRQGPFTLVPMPDALDGTHQSSLVWVMHPGEAIRRRSLTAEAFAREAMRQCVGLLGSMHLESAIGAFPIVTSVSARLTAPRLVLVGEAAHALPPIGAQGLNLSFRDVAVLTAHLKVARDGIGDPARLAAYERLRSRDVATRTTAVGLLNGSLLAHTAGVDALRGTGLALLGTFGPLRRFAMRHGLAPEGAGQVS